MGESNISEPSTKEKRTKVKAWLKSGSLNLFGRPFSGKDTQCSLLAEWLNAPVIGGGDILRKSRNIPKRVQKIMHEGKLTPTNDYLSIVTPYLGQPDFAGQPLVLSSVGRWHGEEQAIFQAAADAGHPIRGVMFLDLNEATVRQRWHIAQERAHRGQRADDAEHLLDVRLDEFRNKTLPVLDFYRRQGLLIEIDGRQTIEDVHDEILHKLYQRAIAA